MYLSVLLVLGRTILLHSCPLGSLVIQALYPISLLVSIPVGNLRQKLAVQVVDTVMVWREFNECF